METLAISRNEVRQTLRSTDEPFIWISIREPEESDSDGFYRGITLPDNCRGVLVLKFSDLISDDWSEQAIDEFQQSYPDIFFPFNLDVAASIDNFIFDNIDSNLCITNCYAGISRSTAISAYVGKLTGERDWFKKYYRTQGRFPCHYVCRILSLPIPTLVK